MNVNNEPASRRFDNALLWAKSVNPFAILASVLPIKSANLPRAPPIERKVPVMPSPTCLIVTPIPVNTDLINSALEEKSKLLKKSLTHPLVVWNASPIAKGRLLNAEIRFFQLPYTYLLRKSPNCPIFVLRTSDSSPTPLRPAIKSLKLKKPDTLLPNVSNAVPRALIGLLLCTIASAFILNLAAESISFWPRLSTPRPNRSVIVMFSSIASDTPSISSA